MSIGDFARATRLTARALRLYHREGLLEPAHVDPVTRYRSYDVDQVADAAAIRRLRELEVPLDLVREVLATSGPRRDELIAGHLARMEAELERTRATVAGLRELLAPPALELSRRRLAPTCAAVVRATIDLADLGAWYVAATRELEQLAGWVTATGVRGGLWSTELFLDEHGPAALFLPLAPDTAEGDLGGARLEQLPAVDLVVATHRGPDETVAAAYAALGEHVARHEQSVPGPVWEFYPEDEVTEIGWPVA